MMVPRLARVRAGVHGARGDVQRLGDGAVAGARLPQVDEADFLLRGHLLQAPLSLPNDPPIKDADIHAGAVLILPRIEPAISHNTLGAP